MSVLLLLGNKLWGLNILYVATSYEKLSNVLRDQGDLKQAKEYHERVLAIMQQTFVRQHSDVASSNNN